jgi:hypothetical protein
MAISSAPATMNQIGHRADFWRSCTPLGRSRRSQRRNVASGELPSSEHVQDLAATTVTGPDRVGGLF